MVDVREGVWGEGIAECSPVEYATYWNADEHGT